jgi:dihydrofolate reductase
MTLSMIWAMGKNRELGKGLKIPWHIPRDFKHFKKITSRHSIIMGLKTYESLDKPLPNRRNIVLDFKIHDIKDVEFATSIPMAIEMVKDEDEAFVIGGASIYKQFFPFVNKLYITHIEHEFDADIFFPEFDLNKWELVSETKGIKDEKNPFDYFCREYVRK